MVGLCLHIEVLITGSGVGSMVALPADSLGVVFGVISLFPLENKGVTSPFLLGLGNTRLLFEGQRGRLFEKMASGCF